MAVTLLNSVLLVVVAMSVSLVDSTFIPTNRILPGFFENCPPNTLPAHSVFNPKIGRFQLLCAKSGHTEGDCVLLDNDNTQDSFRCPYNHVLVGRNKQKPVCCQQKGVRLTDCFKPKILYSFKLGFEFPIKEGYALVGKFNYGKCSEDPTVFQIEVCRLTKMYLHLNTAVRGIL